MPSGDLRFRAFVSAVMPAGDVSVRNAGQALQFADTVSFDGNVSNSNSASILDPVVLAPAIART
jgi:hypothetical protein